MSTDTAAAHRPGLVERLLGGHEKVLVNGHHIRFRREQMIAWGIIAGLCGAAFVAGGYYLLLEQHWYIHLGAFSHGSSLKLWWDNGMGFIHSEKWALYRHGLRNLGEPAIAFLAVGTLLAPPKYWDVRLPGWQLGARLIALIVVAVAAITGGVWLLTNFSWPVAHDAFSWEYLALGFLISHVLLRPIWRPAGATLNGYALDAMAERAGSKTPLWVKHPLAPPVDRERFTLMQADPDNRHSERLEQQSTASLVLVTALFVIITLVTIIGFFAHYWIGNGHTLPYLG